MKKQYQITAEGKKELEAELAELKSRRGEVADKISEARDFGDLSENAEYDAAREEQGLLETRIAEIFTRLYSRLLAHFARYRVCCLNWNDGGIGYQSQVRFFE